MFFSLLFLFSFWIGSWLQSLYGYTTSRSMEFLASWNQFIIFDTKHCQERGEHVIGSITMVFFAWSLLRLPPDLLREHFPSKPPRSFRFLDSEPATRRKRGKINVKKDKINTLQRKELRSKRIKKKAKQPKKRNPWTHPESNRGPPLC